MVDTVGIMSLSALTSFALSHFWFSIDNLCRDALISFKAYRTLKHYKMQVKFKFGGPRNFD